MSAGFAAEGRRSGLFESAHTPFRSCSATRLCCENLWVQLVAAMLRGGFTPEEASMIAGGNYMRIFLVAVG
jgi:hypothetical protein